MTKIINLDSYRGAERVKLITEEVDFIDPGGKGEVVTYKGNIVKPLKARVDTIDIEDIAHSLANQCRFTGHTRYFYSTAQHSVLVSDLVPEEDRLWALLHDASEAYLSDISRPVKSQEEFGKIYRTIEERLMKVISIKFMLSWPMPESVAWADMVLLRTEQRDLMPDLLRAPGTEYMAKTIDPWTPYEAELSFLRTFERLRGMNG